MVLLYFFVQRGIGRKRERERNIDERGKHRSVAFHVCPNQGPNPQPGMSPDQELNW